MSTYKIIHVKQLPDWQKRLYPTIPLADTNFHISAELEPQGYSYKNPLSQKEILEKEVKIVKIELKKDSPVKITVALEESAQNTNSNAIPCVLLIGEDFHKYDFWASIFSSIGLMGYPLEFAMGSATQAAKIEFTPHRNEVIRVAFWVLRGALEVLPEPVKPKTEIKNMDTSDTLKKVESKPKMFMGMDLNALNNPINQFIETVKRTSFYRAWLGHNYELEKNISWKSAPLTCSISTGTKGSPNYSNLISTLQKEYEINSQALCESNEYQSRWLIVSTRLNDSMKAIIRQVEFITSQHLKLLDTSLFSIRMELLSQHPSLYVSLLKNGQTYRNWSLNDVRASYIRYEIAEARSILDILERDTSAFLLNYLPHIGAFDAVVVTKQGLISAATSKDIQLTLWEDPSWTILEQFDESAHTLLVSEPSKEPFLKCEYVTVAMPLTTENTDILGWLLIKMVTGG